MSGKEHGAFRIAGMTAPIYEVQRANNFEFYVTGLSDLVRVGTNAGEEISKFANPEEVLQLSVKGTSVPTFSQEPIQIKKGNTTLKFAGVPTYGEGQIQFHDFIGPEVTDILLAWQRLSCDMSNESVGSLRKTQYKKEAFLVEYTPDYSEKVRTWAIHGCWISNINSGNFSADDGQAHSLEVTFQYDWAEVDPHGGLKAQ